MEKTIASQVQVTEVDEVDDVKVIRRLANWYGVMREAGLTYDDLQIPISDPDFRQRLVQNWHAGAPPAVATTPQPQQAPSQGQGQPAARPPIPQGLFIPPAQQLELVHKWNAERNWGFTDENFDALGVAPEYPAGASRLTTIILEVSLDTVEQTFEQAWQLAVAAQDGRNWRWGVLKSDSKHLRLLSGITHQRGLKWRIVDLVANWDSKDGVRPIDVRNPKSPHSAILWAAAYFPAWVQAMDGTTVPCVWIPGYKVCVGGRQPWSDLPGLSFTRVNREVGLSAGRCGGRDDSWAVPESRE